MLLYFYNFFAIFVYPRFAAAAITTSQKVVLISGLSSAKVHNTYASKPLGKGLVQS